MATRRRRQPPPPTPPRGAGSSSARTRQVWTWEADYLPMFDHLTDGAAVIAARLDRSVDSVRKRASEIAATSDAVGAGLSGLSKAAEAGGFTAEDFRALVQACHRQHGSPLWDAVADELLRTAWAERHPLLPTLAAHLDTGEQQVVDRLITLGLAAGIVEVVDHLGATPGGSVAINAQLSRDKTSVAVWVLIVLDRTATMEITTHPDYDTAHAAAEAGTHLANGQPVVRWQITKNIAGEPRPRRTFTGTPTPARSEPPTTTPAATPPTPAATDAQASDATRRNSVAGLTMPGRRIAGPGSQQRGGDQ